MSGDWRTPLFPHKRREIEGVGASTMVALKSALAEREAARSSTSTTRSAASSAAAAVGAGVTVMPKRLKLIPKQQQQQQRVASDADDAQRNAGVMQRNERDLAAHAIDMREGAAFEQHMSERLREKAELYQRLQRGAAARAEARASGAAQMSEDEQFLVDFEMAEVQRFRAPAAAAATSSSSAAAAAAPAHAATSAAPAFATGSNAAALGAPRFVAAADAAQSASPEDAERDERMRRRDLALQMTMQTTAERDRLVAERAARREAQQARIERIRAEQQAAREGALPEQRAAPVSIVLRKPAS